MSGSGGAVRIDNAALRHEVVLARHGVGDDAALLAAFRSSVLYVPLDADQQVAGARHEGVRWTFAFTTATELAAFAAARDDLGDRVSYATVRGDHVLEGLARVPGDTAVALDVAGDAPMVLPAPHLPGHHLSETTEEVSA